jgi:hypothetical protein
MRIYEVTFTGGISPVGENCRNEWLYFGSHAEARKWCNERIREALARWKQYEGITKLSDVQWGEEIVIKAVETVPITKAAVLRLLNYEGDYFAHREVVERWTPQDKWNAPFNHQPPTTTRPQEGT